MLIDTILVSHRVAGPLFRTVRFLREQSRGQNVGPLVFRKDDYLGELAEAVNATLVKAPIDPQKPS